MFSIRGDATVVMAWLIVARYIRNVVRMSFVGQTSTLVHSLLFLYHNRCIGK